jgi:hypothetical protein
MLEYACILLDFALTLNELQVGGSAGDDQATSSWPFVIGCAVVALATFMSILFRCVLTGVAKYSETMFDVHGDEESLLARRSHKAERSVR